jgi:hypothetical protein
MSKEQNYIILTDFKKLVSFDDKFPKNSQYHILGVINEKINFKTNPFKISDKKLLSINMKIEFPEQLKKIDIKFYGEKQMILEGDLSIESSNIIGVINNKIDLKDSHKETVAELSFNYYNTILNLPKVIEVPENNTIDFYDKYLKEEEKKKIENKNDLPTFSNDKKVSLLNLATGENAENFNTFVKNIDYVRGLLNEINDIVFWKDPYKTITILSIISISILYFSFFTLFLVPLFLILFHLSYREQFVQEFTYKNTPSNKIKNLHLIMWIIELTNGLIESYESLIEISQSSSKELIKDIYYNIIKIVIWNIPLYFIIKSNILLNIDIRFLVVLVLWFIFLFQYPPFRACSLVVLKLVKKMFFDFKLLENVSNIKMNDKLKNSFIFSIPFMDIALKIYENNLRRGNLQEALKDLNNTPIQILLNSNDDDGNNNSSEVLKYEIYEKERWWVGVSWTKKLYKKDGPLWCRVDRLNELCELNQVILPENYNWTKKWNVELSNKSCKNGWEYAKTFSGPFDSNETGKYVRRRKWIRYAKKKEIKSEK